MKNSSSMEVSIVIPVYNEAETIPLLFDRLNALKTELPTKTEVIFVDDGSQDTTVKLCQETKLLYTKQIVQLSRNFGHQAALLAGLEKADGKVVVSMDGDLQHPPELIPSMIAHHKSGINIVQTQRIDSARTSTFKKRTAQAFYSLLNLLSQTQLSPNSADFRSLDRTALDAVLSLPEKRKFLRGIVQWIGFKTVIIPFEVQERVAGESKYNLPKMMRLAIHGLTSFSAVPLYFSGLFSLVLFVLAVLYALYVLMVRFVVGGAVEGWASVLFVVLVVGGFNCLFLSLVGVYIAAIYDEVKNRPLFIEKKS